MFHGLGAVTDQLCGRICIAFLSCALAAKKAAVFQMIPRAHSGCTCVQGQSRHVLIGIPGWVTV